MQETYKLKRFKFDFHGYSIERANKKIYEIINNCYEKGISEILIITGKEFTQNQKKMFMFPKNLAN